MTNKQLNNSKLPQFPEPYWRASVTLPSFPQLTQDRNVDVAIIGAGISGITTAYLLAKEGLKIAIVDAGVILNGTTGHTTAKITAQHDLIYADFLNQLGLEQTKLYYQANQEALRFIQATVQEEQIDCDLLQDDAYIYTNSTDYLKNLRDEFQAYERLDIEGAYFEELPLPFPTKAAISMKNQAQFHPLKYLKHLVDWLSQQTGVEIYEQTTALDIEEGERPKVIIKGGPKITCKQVIICSHYPFYDGMGLYFSRMYADRSYALAIKTEKEYPGGMYISAEDPVRSLRYTLLDGEQLVIVGGESHKTGQGMPTIKHYETLETFAETTFGIRQLLYRWSTQDLITLDKLPYIGQITAKQTNIFVATGYKKWGMTTGTAAALLLRDQILGKENPYSQLFSPSRFHVDPSVKNFVVQNADVAKHLVKGKLEIVNKQPEDLAPDEGAVVTVNGKRAGAYRDQEGKLHIVDTTCTHMGCEVEWNNGERTWDCPCHGSRFAINGDVIEGPAERALQRLKIEQAEKE